MGSDAFDALLLALKQDEGTGAFKGGKFFPYTCPAGKLTIGYGHNLENNGITPAQAQQLLVDDAIQAMRDASDLVPNWLKLSYVRQNVMTNMSYNMGKTTFSTFKKFLKAVNDGDYNTAAKEMQNSLWYSQVGPRGERLRQEMLTGTALL